jgi:hypothetical protein
MRNFQVLDKAIVDSETGIIHFSVEQEDGMRPKLAMRREGSYVAISASYGPLEIALRPRYAELGRTLSRLSPVAGLQTTRQVGTGQAYLSLGLQSDGSLLIRPTIVADATGHLGVNLVLTDAVRQALYDWLPVDEAARAPQI